MTLKSDAKFEEKMICCFKNNKNLLNFDLSTRNSQNFHFNWVLLCKVYNVWPKKCTEELSYMTLKSDAKFGEELTWRFKIDMRNLSNFELSTRKSQEFSL